MNYSYFDFHRNVFVIHSMQLIEYNYIILWIIRTLISAKMYLLFPV